MSEAAGSTGLLIAHGSPDARHSTALRLLATAIDRARGPQPGAARESATEPPTAETPGFKRRLLRGGLWLIRCILLVVAWPLDHLLRLPVPAGQRYYRLWLLKRVTSATYAAGVIDPQPQQQGLNQT